MSVYFIVNSTIDDQALLDDYVQAAGATLGVVPLKLLAVDVETEHIEGEAAGLSHRHPRVRQRGRLPHLVRLARVPGDRRQAPRRATTGFAILAHGV